nr:hypothetical protein GCM10020092_067630 [Actinoplanes digitatis]
MDADAIYVKDANVWTSAGVTAGIDLALALVAEDHGHELARQVARGLVVYLQRPGGQSQFSTPMRASTPPSERFRELQAFIDDNPTGDLSVPALARRSAMSERHFSRLFTAQTGMSPGRYVERSRAEAARRRLEVTADPLDRIARESGLGGPETLYRIFRRALADLTRRLPPPLPRRGVVNMHIAIPLYPRYTALDAVGPYTVLAFTEGFTVTFVAARPGAVLDDQGSLALTATKSYADLPYPDVIVVPGGPGTVEALQDKDLIDWITVAHERTRWTTSVCSGSFLLGAAGLLNGRRATTHWGWLEHLSGFGAQPVSERVVIDDRIITAAGVSA